MDSKFFVRPPVLHPYTSIFEKAPRQNSPNSIFDHATSLSPIHSPVEKKTKKTVSFKPVAFVILIPCRSEYFISNIAHQIWSTEAELNYYKQSALQQVRELLTNNPDMSIKEAIMYDNSVEKAESNSRHESALDELKTLPSNCTSLSIQEAFNALAFSEAEEETVDAPQGLSLRV